MEASVTIKRGRCASINTALPRRNRVCVCDRNAVDTLNDRSDLSIGHCEVLGMQLEARGQAARTRDARRQRPARGETAFSRPTHPPDPTVIMISVDPKNVNGASKSGSSLMF